MYKWSLIISLLKCVQILLYSWVFWLDSKVVFGSCKIFFGNAIFGKGKYFQAFGCISKNVLKNIF